MKRLFYRQDPCVITGLLALMRDPDLAPASAYIADMLLYAEVGKDRRDLGPEYVEQVERRARESADFIRSYERRTV